MKNNSHKSLLIFSIIFLVFSCFLFFIINREIVSNKTAYEDSELKWRKEVDKIEGIKLLNSSFKKIEKEKDLIETHFARSSNIVPFLDTMEAVGNNVGLKTEVTLIDVPKESKVLIIEMSVYGSFESIYKFLLLLENSQYQLETISMDIQKENTSGAVVNKKDKNKEVIPKWKADFRMKLLSFIP